MRSARPAFYALLFTFLFAACNQPFEPEGPVNNALVVFSILNAQTDTQYVRLTTTSGSSTAPVITDAFVTMTSQGGTVYFHDTTVQWLDASGKPSPTVVYVAYNFSPREGWQYTLTASRPSGLSTSATTTALAAPTLDLMPNTPKEFTLQLKFNSVAGAYVTHFYFDYYALINNGWKLIREEVPENGFRDVNGDSVTVYPTIAPVRSVADYHPYVQVQFDSVLYVQEQKRLFKLYNGEVVFMHLEFDVTQIDDILYGYYYINNGLVDPSTIRLDQSDYTNFAGGYGVFGSRTGVQRKIVTL
jgi:hypothetical protein